MPMDFNYTVEQEQRPVYHILYRCPEADNIHKDNRKYGSPPASDKRVVCSVCLRELNAWIADFNASK